VGILTELVKVLLEGFGNFWPLCVGIWVGESGNPPDLEVVTSVLALSRAYTTPVGSRWNSGNGRAPRSPIPAFTIVVREVLVLMG
jgi:hypothetical protein